MPQEHLVIKVSELHGHLLLDHVQPEHLVLHLLQVKGGKNNLIRLNPLPPDLGSPIPKSGTLHFMIISPVKLTIEQCQSFQFKI